MRKTTRLNYLFQLLNITALNPTVNSIGIVAEIIKELDLNPAEVLRDSRE